MVLSFSYKLFAWGSCRAVDAGTNKEPLHKRSGPERGGSLGGHFGGVLPVPAAARARRRGQSGQSAERDQERVERGETLWRWGLVV